MKTRTIKLDGINVHHRKKQAFLIRIFSTLLLLLLSSFTSFVRVLSSDLCSIVCMRVCVCVCVCAKVPFSAGIVIGQTDNTAIRSCDERGYRSNGCMGFMALLRLLREDEKKTKIGIRR